MRKLLISAALVGSLACGSAAFAANAPKTAPASKEKTASCEASWKAQKTHNEKHSAFIKACVAKG